MSVIDENLKLIKEGKELSIDYSEKVRYQYKFKKYSENILNFIFSLDKKDIDLEYHLDAVDSKNLMNFIKKLDENQIKLSDINKQADTLLTLISLENYGQYLLTPKEKSEIFNKHLSYRDADIYINSTLFDVLKLEDKNIYQKLPNYPRDDGYDYSKFGVIESNIDFDIFKTKIAKNIKNFSTIYDLEMITSYPDYETYLINSFEISDKMKSIISMKGFNYEESFSTLKDILPSSNKEQAFLNIIISNFFDNKGNNKLDVARLNDLPVFIKNKSLGFNINDLLENPTFILDANRYFEICDKAPKFIEYLKINNKSKIDELEAKLLENMLEPKVFTYNIYNIEDLNKKIDLIKNHEQINSIGIKKNKLDEIFNEIQKQLLTKIEFDIFTTKFNSMNNTLKIDNPKAYEIINEGSNPLSKVFGMKEIMNKAGNEHSLSFLKPCFEINELEQNKIDNLLIKINELKIEFEPYVVKKKIKKTKKL
jgi:hypothetical protein